MDSLNLTGLDLHGLMLAQDGAVPLPGETTSLPLNPDGSGGTTGGASGAPSSGPFGPSFMFIMLGAIVVMILVSSIGPRRERKRREALINSVRKHDQVQTAGGIIGSIVELKPDHVVLKVDESANIRITFARSAIQQVLTPRTDDETSSPSS